MSFGRMLLCKNVEFEKEKEKLKLKLKLNLKSIVLCHEKRFCYSAVTSSHFRQLWNKRKTFCFVFETEVQKKELNLTKWTFQIREKAKLVLTWPVYAKQTALTLADLRRQVRLGRRWLTATQNRERKREK